MRVDNLSRVFRMIAEGRIQNGQSHTWVCPQCSIHTGPSGRPDERDRRALDHFLLTHCGHPALEVGFTARPLIARAG